MKRVSYITIFILLLAFSGCSEDFLDRKDLYRQLDENFYSNPQQIFEALTATYTKLTSDWGGANYGLVCGILGPDRLGGGAEGDLDPHDTDEFRVSSEDNYIELWETQYEGIFRANMIISNFEKAEYDNEIDQNRDLGEAYFLRAMFYYRLATLFGTAPLITDPAPVNLPRASADDIFALIGSDFKKAIELMPDIPYQQIPAEMSGRATRWAAQGMLARALLFYTGYYNKTELPLTEGGAITQAQVLNWLEDGIQNSGHDLLDDPRNLYSYTVPEVDSVYDYVTMNNLEFAGDGNKEVVFSVKYSSYSDWSLPGRTSYSNQAALYQGMRVQTNGVVPFSAGWGFGPVNPLLWESFEEGDIRQHGFILNIADDVPGEDSIKAIYNRTPKWADPQYTETGHWNKKGMGTVIYQGANIVGYYANIYGGNSNMQLWNMQDDILLRFADVLLMAAELGSSNAVSYVNEIRERAQLGPVSSVTLDVIKQERRHELCCEGLRYHDVLRWGDAEAAFAEASGFTVYTGEKPETYDNQFNPDRIFLKVPESEVRLSNGVLVQDPGWLTE